LQTSGDLLHFSAEPFVQGLIHSVCAGRNDYKALERSFWKSVTINPPIYGADTPMSLFDSHVKGWGLGSISDLLKDKGLPDIPGVTTPMAYFGMWKVSWANACQRGSISAD
jgi:hypothetical protein